MIYLDNAATTFPKPESVYCQMDRVNRTLAVNAGRGSYAIAKEATKIIDTTKELLIRLFHADEIADICFTPSITHAMNQILRGIKLSESDVVYLTPYEHNAVARTIFMLQKDFRFEVRQIPLDADLKIDLERTSFEFARKRPSIVIATKVSNVTGYVLPDKELFRLAKDYNAVTILDAAQAAGLLDIDMRTNNADIVCFAGHKTLYGPFGVGGFAIKKNVDIGVSFAGGTGSNSLSLNMPESSPEKYEASSQNVVAIAGLCAALQTVNQELHLAHTLEITDYLLSELKTISNIRLMGTFDTNDTIGIVSFIVDGYSSDDVGTILDDEFGIAVRTGFHCAPYIHDYLEDKEYQGTVRVGVGLFTTKDDIDHLIEALRTL